MPKLTEPKFKKTPKNRKKDQFKSSRTADKIVGEGLMIGAVAPVALGMGKKKKTKKATPEIKADAAKKGKMIKLKGGGAAIRGTNFKGVF